jgi:hypothetical protein
MLEVPATGRQSGPPRREHPEQVPARKQCDIAFSCVRSGDHSVHARSYLLRRLAAGASVPEDQPARRDLMDLLRR